MRAEGEQGSTGYAAAELEGFYAQQGLTFRPTWATSGTVLLQGLVSGDFDVANHGPAQLYDAIGNGACARALRPTQGAACGVIVRTGLHLDTTLPYPRVLTQLRGRTIGVAARGAAQELVLRSLLKDAGLNPDTDVSWVAIGVGAAAASALASGQVDAAMSYSQLETNLAAEGSRYDKLVDLAGSHTLLGAFWQSVAVANCGWADDHHDTVMKFCFALNQGFEALEKDPAAGPRAFAWLGLGPDPGRARILWKTYNMPVVDIPPLNRTNWNHQAKFASGGTAPDISAYVVDGCATA
ncbi:ABC transporter substrate-binding protein [Actinoplanes sp. Pm04-4]|uniref:ABC transporter substrate-binding protein n=1 Tax=Paractinoplanes pyxinae TaxID=2997416 RepID=A0ABT4AQ76_9ACTN|nr:ABC transporter substrate-binding protein [Actinoplanes pyxinae]MCY1136399.1 ABC transporter substrate-binding protein [Actinoplanes pyxinae]